MSFLNVIGNKITAKCILQYAAMGVMASQDNIEVATKQLIENGIDKVAAPTAFKALRFLNMGILPSMLFCESSINEIAAAEKSKCESGIVSSSIASFVGPNLTLSH